MNKQIEAFARFLKEKKTLVLLFVHDKGHAKVLVLLFVHDRDSIHELEV